MHDSPANWQGASFPDSEMTVSTLQPGFGRGLTISIVVYRPDMTVLMRTAYSLCVAVDRLRSRWPALPIFVYLVDNGGAHDLSPASDLLRDHGIGSAVLSGHGNVGYGCGHNLAIDQIDSGYHLILNPDIDLDNDALACSLDFFDRHPALGLLSPFIAGEDGHIQYLCRRVPTVLDLFVRGFLPVRLRKPFGARLARYEMRDRINERDVVWEPPIVSGCFMLFRTDVLKWLAGFDARYFLYFEDYDLSLRAHDVTRVAYVPDVRIVHYGGGAARKGWLHVRLFVASAFKFFNRFGWRWW